MIFNVDEVRDRQIKFIDNDEISKEKRLNRLIKVWTTLEEMLNQKDELLTSLEPGVGCFMFYLAYVKLVNMMDEEPEFKQFLLEEMKYKKASVLIENAYQAAKYAKEIREMVEQNKANCEKDWDKINPQEWEREIDDFLLQHQPLPPPRLDVTVGDYVVQPKSPKTGEEVTIRFVVKNIGDQAITTPFFVKWSAYDGHIGKYVKINSLAELQDTTIILTYTFSYTGKFQTKAEVDENNKIEEIDEQNNVEELMVQVLDPIIGEEEDTVEVGPDTLIETEFVYGNYGIIGVYEEYAMAPSELEYELIPTADDRSCIFYSSEFPIGIIRTYPSDKIDFRLLAKVLKPFLNNAKLSISDAESRIVGFSDRHQFQPGTVIPFPIELKVIPAGTYRDLSTDSIKYMPAFTEITNNKQLAYARAYYLKIKLIRQFNLNPSDIPIAILENVTKAGSAWRGANLQMCWDSLKFEALLTLAENTPEVLEKGTTYPAEKPIVDHSIKQDILDTVETVTTDNSTQEQLVEGQIIAINSIIFEATESDVTQSALDSAYHELVAFIIRNPSVKFEIAGHTNTICTNCQALSTERAKMVYDGLIERGAPKERLTYKGYGKTQPISTESLSKKGREKDQRVEIRVLKISE